MSAEPRHVDDEVFVRWACNELTAAEVARVQAHLENCEECSDIWRAVRQVQSEARQFDAGAAPEPQVSPRRARFGRAALATAALAATVLLSVSLLQRRPARGPDSGLAPPAVRSTVSEAVSKEPEPLRPEEGEQVSSPHFAWTAVDGADGYVVDLLDEAGELVWTSEPVETTELRLPDTLIPAPGVYFWRVSSQSLGHDPVSSPLVAFEIANR